MARHVLPRIGAFPIDREGTDLRAFKTGVEILAEGEHPLVIFPEGEIYYTCDRLTPLREGAVAFATTAAKRLADRGKTVWIVPTAIKYRFLDGDDPMPALVEVMDRLEARFTWWPRVGPPARRADLHATPRGCSASRSWRSWAPRRSGPLKERIAAFATRSSTGSRTSASASGGTTPCPSGSRSCAGPASRPWPSPGPRPNEALELRRDLNDIFVALQLFSYPGDYVRQDPTLERIAETLLKFEQDILGAEAADPRGPRRAIVRFGEPIDVGQTARRAGQAPGRQRPDHRRAGRGGFRPSRRDRAGPTPHRATVQASSAASVVQA